MAICRKQPKTHGRQTSCILQPRTTAMYSIHHLHHTADICLRVEADILQDLFHGGLEAMTTIMREDAGQPRNPLPLRFSVETASVDRTALLVDFLSDVLVLMQTEKAVFCEMDMLLLEEKRVVAEIRGYPVSGFDEDIKAVTYHQADVHRREDGKWETLIIFDI